MDLLQQLSNKAAYAVHAVTYDPDAELYAKDKMAAAKTKLDETTNAKNIADKAAKIAATDKKQKTDKADAEKKRTDRENFDYKRMAIHILKIVGIALAVTAIVTGCILGASLATNLNIYHSWPYRVLYAIYGFLFFFIVIPYVMLYRWWWKGNRPHYYGLIPIIPYKFDNSLAGLLFGWMSYRPDKSSELLKEWIHN